ncbi:MAG TPA: luciferase family protein [Longimicrobiaceae bacterium]
MTRTRSASEQIIEEVGSWPGVKVTPGSRGELSFRVGRKEIGHLHGERAAHFGFPKPIWTALRQQGRIAPHPVFPGKEGPASRRIDSPEDVYEVIELMRINYQRIMAAN